MALIFEASTPAPNPLSILTTPTPGSSKTLSNVITVVFSTAGVNGQTFTGDEKFILKGLNSTWSEDCFNLIEESLGLNFTNDTVTTKTIYIRLVVSDTVIGQKKSWNGKLLNDTTSKFCFDRTAAHEFAHSADYANMQYYALLPNWIKEGLSDILLGDDDNHTQAILNFTTSQQDKLITKNILPYFVHIP